MSKADEIFIANMRQIIDEGISDEAQNVRPHWADGTPAHTKKVFCLVNRYNLAEEFPAITYMSCTATFGTVGRTKRAVSAKHTATNWASNITTRRATSIKWTECCTT